jgi:hypothetical protein
MQHFYKNIQGWFTFPDLYRRIVKDTPPGGSIVEVGAWRGKSTAFLAVEIINNKPDITLHVVDTWLGSGEHANMPVIKEGRLFDEFLENMKPVEHVLTIHRMPSVEATRLFKDESLDAVFLDASHKYEDVKADILAWRSKVRKGGILAGHDYHNGAGKVGVAVDELLHPITVQEMCWIYSRPTQATSGLGRFLSRLDSPESHI